MALCCLSLVSIRQTESLESLCTYGYWGSPSEGMPCRRCPEGATCKAPVNKCPEGATCEAPVNKWPRVRAGFYAKPTVRSCLLTRPEKDYCFLKCLPKGEQCRSYDEQVLLQSKMIVSVRTKRPLCHDADDSSTLCDDQQCREGYQGILCAQCADGWFMHAKKCHKCEAPMKYIFFAIPVLVVLVLLLLIYLAVIGVNPHTMAGVSLLIAYGQTMAVLNSFSLTWPRPFNEVLALFAPFSFKITFLRVDCWLTTSVYSRNFFVFSVVVWVPLFYAFVHLVWTRVLGKKALNRGIFVRSSVAVINLAYLPSTAP